MKTILAILTVTSGLCFQAFAAPDVTLEQAVRIANEYLREHGQEQGRQLVSVTQEATSLTRSKLHWVVSWSPAFVADGRQQTGLQVEMDGTVARMVMQNPIEKAAERARRPKLR